MSFDTMVIQVRDDIIKGFKRLQINLAIYVRFEVGQSPEQNKQRYTLLKKKKKKSQLRCCSGNEKKTINK